MKGQLLLACSLTALLVAVCGQLLVGDVGYGYRPISSYYGVTPVSPGLSYGVSPLSALTTVAALGALSGALDDGYGYGGRWGRRRGRWGRRRWGGRGRRWGRRYRRRFGRDRWRRGGRWNDDWY